MDLTRRGARMRHDTSKAKARTCFDHGWVAQLRFQTNIIALGHHHGWKADVRQIARHGKRLAGLVVGDDDRGCARRLSVCHLLRESAAPAVDDDDLP